MLSAKRSRSRSAAHLKRGELRPDLDSHLAVASLVGSLIFLRITSTLPDSGDDLAEHLVGQLLDGMGAQQSD
ncbi:MAG: TetR/AcrR family transcriptional regulator C-terminal ligand-binding domain-containing protein [Actinobacteria bacterium]|nr:TetR/AcrR family transcriptional regulator C-terminal ligand-binding domain-containing protein [Actinomycetota bacterium]